MSVPIALTCAVCHTTRFTFSTELRPISEAGLSFPSGVIRIFRQVVQQREEGR
jgi:hypothetical protein